MKASEHHLEMIGDRVAAGIDIMRSALADAERSLKAFRESGRTPDELTTDVLHAFAWGWANACAQIENGVRNTSRMYEARLREMEAATKAGDEVTP